MKRLIFSSLLAVACLVPAYAAGPKQDIATNVENATQTLDKKAQKELEKAQKAEKKRLDKERKQRDKEQRIANAKIKVDIKNDMEWHNIGNVTLNYYYENLISTGWQKADGELFKHNEKDGAYYVTFKGIRYMAEPYYSQYKWRFKANDGYYYHFNVPRDMEDGDKTYTISDKIDAEQSSLR